MKLVVSHYRSGTHLLMWMIWKSFETDLSGYEKLFLSHKPLSDVSNAIHIIRDPKDVMVSLFRMRNRFAIAKDFSFSTFLRTRYIDMPGARNCEVRFNGKLVTRVVRDLTRIQATPLEYWQDITTNFCEMARLTISYCDLLKSPEEVLSEIAKVVPWKRLSAVIEIPANVGYSPMSCELDAATDNDLQLINTYRKQHVHSQDYLSYA